jgi:uncharacterized protein (TIGR02246 family)
MRTHLFTGAIALILGGLLASGFAQQRPNTATTAQPASVDTEALRLAGASYVAAFNKGDLAALMGHWTGDPEFVDSTGKSIRGRDALAALFKSTFEESKGATMKVTTKATRFLKPDIAVQDGIAKVTALDGESSSGGFTAIWMKTDGKWLLSRVQDLPGEDAAALGSNFERLKELDWLVGDWESEAKQTPVTFTCKWRDNKNFLIIEQVIHLRDQEALTLTQLIGWDPLQQQLRSWLFDSRGGFGESLWTRNGNSWDVDSAGVLSDGRTSSSTSTWKYVNDNTCEWDSVDRQIDGRPVPDIKVKYVRKGAKSE